MADVAFGHRATAHALPATMDHPCQWHYVATWVMAHMWAYSPDGINRLHWLWHQRAALRIRATMQEHNIWAIPGSPSSQKHALGHQRPRSQEVSEPTRQTASHSPPETPPGATTWCGFPPRHTGKPPPTSCPGDEGRDTRLAPGSKEP